MPTRRDMSIATFIASPPAPTADNGAGVTLRGWDFDTINAEADRLRAIRAEHGVGAMLAEATGVPADVWVREGGVDRSAGE